MNRTVLSLFSVDPRRIGGVEVYAREMSRQLADRGWNSDLCFSTHPPPDVARYLTLPNVRFHTLENTVFNNTQVLRPFLRLIAKVRPSVLHSQFTPDVGPFAMLARLSGVRRVAFTCQTSRSSPRPNSYSGVRALVARTAMRPVGTVVAISDFVHDWYAAWGVIDPARIHRVYNAVDIDRRPNPGAAASFRERFGIPGNRPIVSQVATVSNEKGVPDLLRAAKLVLAQTDAQFVFVGDGPTEQESRALAAELGIAGRVTWAGLASDPVGEGVFDAAAVVCLCSRWQEAFGWVLAEAMIGARPIVGTHVGAIPEIVEHERTGLLAPKEDVDAIAAHLLRLLANPKEAIRFGQAGYRKATEQYDVRKTVAEVIRLYRLEEL